jgi:hypothetical protein
MKGVDIMTYWVILGITIIARVTGMEAAYEVYHKACELAELIGSNCMLVTEEDEKVITKYKYEEE